MNGFLIYFVIAWFLVHRVTGGSYRRRGKGLRPESALVMLACALAFACVGAFAPVSEFIRMISVGFLWHAIVSLRSAQPASSNVESIEEHWRKLQAEREQAVKKLENSGPLASPPHPPPAAQESSATLHRQDLHEARGDLEQRGSGSNIPHRHKGGRAIDTGDLAPGEYRQYSTEKENVSAGARDERLSPASPQQYRSAQAEVQDLVSAVLQTPAEDLEAVKAQLAAEQARYEGALSGEEARYQAEQAAHEAELQAEIARAVEETRPQAQAGEGLETGEQTDAEPQPEAAPEQAETVPEPVMEPEAVPEPERADREDLSRNWAPPGFQRRAEQVASSTPQQRPDSMFSSSGPLKLGSSVASRFSNPVGSQPLTAAEPGRAGLEAELQSVLGSNQLRVDEELTRPSSVLETAEKEQGPGFRYQPAAGIKSRF